MTKRITVDFLKHHQWLLLTLLLLVGLGFLQFRNLNDRPLHNDEGVNAMFLDKLIKKGAYKYNPNNFHGPSLYYFHILPVQLNTFLIHVKKGAKDIKWKETEGLTSRAMRVPIVMTGLLILILILLFKPELGAFGTFISILMLGVSSNYLYFSRYFIHEIYVVLFTFLIFVGFYKFYIQKKKFYLYIGIISLSFLFCTKETSLVHLFILFFSHFCALWLEGILNRKRFLDQTKKGWSEIKTVLSANKLETFTALLIAVGIWFSLYSAFYKNLPGLLDSFRTFLTWGPRGLDSGHIKGFFYFLEEALFRYEFAVMALSVVGLVASIVRVDRFGLYLSFWMLGMLGAYSSIPYKTPWLVINIIFPMALLGGYGVQSVFDGISKLRLKNKKGVQVLFALVIILVVLLEIPLSLRLNFKEYDGRRHTQVYQHTHRDIYDIVDEVDLVADQSNLGADMPINVVVKDYWPMPFYLRKYKKVGYYHSIPEDDKNLDAPVLIVEQSKTAKLAKHLKDKYSQRFYRLREEVQGRVYINEEIAKKKELVFPILFKSIRVGKDLKSGWIQDIYKGMNFQRGPIKEKHDPLYGGFSWENYEDKTLTSPFSIRWRGLIKIDKAGPTTFHLESDDGSFMSVNDYLIIDNGGTHERVKKSKTVNLAKGYHEIEVKYFDWLGEAIFKLTWSPPDSVEQPIPQELLFHEK